MNSTSMWLLCLLGLALLNQGLSRPQAEGAKPLDYQEDGEVDDYDEGEYEDNVEGPPPVIRSTPVHLVLEEGGVAFLPCDVEGNPNAFSRVWRKDEKGLFVGSVRETNDPRINQLSNGTLEIRQLQASDIGTYSCLISVESKQDVVHTIQVKSPAKITKITPNDRMVTVKLSSSLVLECIAQGYPTPSIKWFKNGHVLEDTDPSIHGARYTIENASADDAGMYKCTATNGQQVPDEKTIEVQVHYPPQIKIAQAIVPTGVGYESELKCTVTGLKKPELKWYKGTEDKPIVQSSRIHLERSGHDHILKIVKTQQSDFGEYTCEAKNSEGQKSAVITLTGTPSTPILEESGTTVDELKNPMLKYKVETFAPIEEYELLYKGQEKDKWISLTPAVVSSEDGRFFTLVHTFTDLEPGVYEAQLRAKNSYGWSGYSAISTFPKEHKGDLTQTGLLAVSGPGSSSGPQLRISLGLFITLLVAHFYC